MKKSITLLFSLLCLFMLSSCDEILSNDDDVVTSQKPTQDGFSSGFNLHDAVWTFQNQRSYKKTVGTCFFKFKNSNFIVQRAAFNCVTASKEIAERVKFGMNSGVWLSSDSPFSLQVSSKSKVVYKELPELRGRRCDFISTLNEMPVSEIMNAWDNDGIKNNYNYPLCNGEQIMSGRQPLYKTTNLFGVGLNATVTPNSDMVGWTVIVYVPSKELAEFLVSVFDLYYYTEDVTIEDSSLKLTAYSSSYTDFIELFDIISYQPLEAIILAYGLLDMDKIMALE